MHISRRKAVQLFGGAMSAAALRRSFAMGLGQNGPASIPVTPGTYQANRPSLNSYSIPGMVWGRQVWHLVALGTAVRHRGWRLVCAAHV